MAMPSGNVVMSDKMQYPVVGTGGMVASGGVGDVVGGVVVGGSGGAEIHPRQWFPDERDGFIMWLRGEFAASNAIIDSMCHHFRAIGDPGEYDAVIASIQQRRCNWNPVLHMQQYFSIAEVASSLQQVAWRRQQQSHNRYFDPAKGSGFKRGGGNGGFRQGHRMDGSYREWSVSNSDNRGSDNSLVKGEKLNEPVTQVKKSDDKKDSVPKPNANSCLKSSGNSEENIYSNSGSEIEEADDGSNTKGSCNALCDNDSQVNQSQSEKHNLTTAPKTFDVSEICEGKPVNIVDGLKLYQDFFDGSEVSKLVSLVHDLKAAGKKGQFQGHTFLSLKRPMKGHGRDIIQFGVPISDLPPQDELTTGTCIERKIDAIPALLRDVLERLVSMQVTTVKPDSCIIDIYNEGDHSQPQIWPSSFGRPVCVMFLTDCDMTFGRVIGLEHPATGDYRGPLKLSLTPGSLLVAQGRSADIAKHAIPSVRKQRILVTFIKSQPKKTLPNDGLRSSPPLITSSAHWGPQLSRPPHHVRHHQVAKHYSPVPPTGVLPAPAARPQHAPQNGVQPIFLTATVAPTMPFSAPVTVQPGTAWPVVTPRHAPPRLPVPGTGVFLPPGSGNSLASQHISSNTVTDAAGYSEETPVLPERENGSVKSINNSNSQKGKKENDDPEKVECNGSVDESGSAKASTNEENQHSDEKMAFE